MSGASGRPTPWGPSRPGRPARRAGCGPRSASRRSWSSAACASASLTICSISDSERPLEASIRIFCSLPVALSLAETCRMPLASMSKVTSICGMPRGAGGMPVSWNLPMVRLSRRHLALALEHVDLHRGLVVLGGREDLDLLGRDGRVPRDQHRGHAAQRLDAERQRGHVEQQHVLHLAGEHAALDRRADGHDLVGVDALVRLLAEELLDRSPGSSGCASSRRPGSPRRSRPASGPASFERLLHRRHRALRSGRRPAARTWPGSGSRSGASGPTGPP